MARPILGACRSVLIYLAGPLFSEAERRFNLELTQRLEALGFDIFLPQRDGVERGISTDAPLIRESAWSLVSPTAGNASREARSSSSGSTRTPARPSSAGD